MAVRSHFGDRNKMDLEQLVKSVKEVEGKVEEQNEVIGLLQAEVEFQNDRITAQDKVIKELTAKVIIMILMSNSIFNLGTTMKKTESNCRLLFAGRGSNEDDSRNSSVK